MPTVTSLNAVDFGLTSGSSNQTSNLQAAINAAQTQNLPLFIPAGSFPITTVNITAPIEIYSTGGVARIVGFGQSPKLNIAPTVAGNRFGPVTVRGLVLYGAHQTLSGGTDPAMIRASEIDNIVVSDCVVQDSGFHGICYSQCFGYIENNRIPGSLEFGILVTESERAVFIDQNDVTFSGNNGIYIYRATSAGDQSVISNNQIGFSSANSGGTGPYGNAIVVANSSYVKVIDNMIYTSAFSAIRCSGSSNLIVTGNQCYNSTENAIYIEGPGAGASWYGGVISNNRVDGCGSGIIAANSNFGARWINIIGNQVSGCTDNTITHSGGSYQTWGYGIVAEADALITGNQVDGAASWGVFVYPTDNGSIGQKVLSQIESNMLKNCAGGIGFYKDDTAQGRLLISGNMIYAYTTTVKYAAIVPVTYNGATGEASKISGATDLGNATSSGFANVILLRNFSFT